MWLTMKHPNVLAENEQRVKTQLNIKPASLCQLISQFSWRTMTHPHHFTVCNIIKVAKANIWNNSKGGDSLSYWCKQQNTSIFLQGSWVRWAQLTKATVTWCVQGPVFSLCPTWFLQNKSVKYVKNAYCTDRRRYKSVELLGNVLSEHSRSA